MFELYDQQIKDLQEWFEQEIKGLPPLEITKDQYRGGIDDMPANYRKLSHIAFEKWLNERHYGLSYNQACIAFFNAAKSLGLLKIAAS